jgi:hypothetical protein
MAMINCAECQHQVSDKAPTCPSCGAPVARMPVPPAAGAPSSPQQEAKKTSKGSWVLLILIIMGGIWFFQSPTYREQSLPPMPVTIKYRNALTGPGLVLMVTNISTRHLSIAVVLKNPSMSQQKNYRLDVSPNGTTEVGYREGWILASGDGITLSHNDYKSWNGSIP